MVTRHRFSGILLDCSALEEDLLVPIICLCKISKVRYATLDDDYQ
jgi:hypothetical protein